MASTSYKILAGIELDTSGIQSQLNGIKAEIPMKVDSSGVENFALTWQEANAIMQTSLNIIESMVEQTYALDDALTQFKKVSELRGDELNSYVDNLSEAGQTVARSASDMVSAATEFKKSGFSEEDSATLAGVATMFQNIADSEVSAGDAANLIISQMKAFGIEADSAYTIIDSINEVSNNYAVSSTDLSSALSKTSSAMAVLGNDFNETLGLYTAGHVIHSQYRFN